MSFFKFEPRNCPDCGQEFEGLAIWDDDVPCGKCGTARYEERLRKVGEGRSYTVTSIGGACPTQAEGVTADGRPYYFRARHGRWTLDVGEVGWPEYCEWPGDVWDQKRIADGDDPSQGWMEDTDVLSILDQHLECA